MAVPTGSVRVLGRPPASVYLEGPELRGARDHAVCAVDMCTDMMAVLFCRWREAVEGRKKLRRQMQAFPAAPCCVDVNNQLWALAPSAECPVAEENLARGMLDLGHAGKVGISCTRSACTFTCVCMHVGPEIR